MENNDKLFDLKKDFCFGVLEEKEEHLFLSWAVVFYCS